MTILHASYSQLAFSGLRSALPDGRALAGLIAEFEPNAPVIWTGVHEGPVRIECEASSREPRVELDDWEDVAEFTALRISTEQQTSLWGLMSISGDPMVRMDIPDAGPVRVRVAARGRDANPDLGVDEACEDYLVQTFPEPVDTAGPVAVLKSTSRIAVERSE